MLMAQQPSRRDPFLPPPRVGDVRPTVRHMGVSLRRRDPGYLDGRFATPQPNAPGPSLLVGDGGGEGDTAGVLGEDGDRYTVTSLTNPPPWRLTYDPIAETVHVRWHPGGGAGVPWLREDLWSIADDDNVITFTAATLAANGVEVGDVFSAQYLHLDLEEGPDEVDFSIVGVSTGVLNTTTGDFTFDLPDGTQEDDLLFLAIRGYTGPGGGDTVDGLTSTDTRLELIASATMHAEAIWAGIETGSGAPVVANVHATGFTPSADGRLVVVRGVNGVGSHTMVESGTTTPVLAGTCTLAVTWDGNAGFGSVNAEPPDGYTDIVDTGTASAATDISYWFDPGGSSSPAGTFSGQGCCVVALI